MGSRAGISTVQSSHSARISCAVGGDQLALGEGLEADQRPHEAEFGRLDDPGLQQLEAPLRRGGFRPRVDQPEVRQEVERHLDRQLAGGCA
jgi:hypothetical protein